MFDNLSPLSRWCSDAPCRLATGGGFATRELYSDAEETLFDATRPVVLNGIGELATSENSDLLDRSLLLYPPPISARHRRTEAEFWSSFEDVRPRILGALLDVISGALGRVPTVNVPELPRLADFAVFATAAEPSLGLNPGTVLHAYRGNRDATHEATLAGSPLADRLEQLAADGWSGTPTDLTAALAAKGFVWLKGAHALSVAVRRIAPSLRSRGVEILRERTAGPGSRRIMTLRQTVATVASVATCPGRGRRRRRCDRCDAIGRSGGIVPMSSPKRARTLTVKQNPKGGYVVQFVDADGTQLHALLGGGAPPWFFRAERGGRIGPNPQLAYRDGWFEPFVASLVALLDRSW